ncbi:conserved membrane hypothetical protein [Bosea sp. 62]|uniref:hypothetical protein n=1 Tax=unclassified Bosea (in: a-proteobacteria) TaxID=2653178 RepID=UPI001257F72E|nr:MULTISPECIES: hypothetical protein [unclassified Bosea (in: a-proteobacteria)]CAD5246963.1 conserved membrane hypothetical protein [Bosea sp. 46]CAD5248805.1 conserved membrane hypothetical protein [Bosea sp. 21B]CAD5267324.1 conserved membrane hypothetical protein [Bosea sp. 7B]VVT45325.1 conserved membrane hypothetical protein [Bosea sp. EC-HK365B]VXA96577.1 conserved membrane hypothetical protein [Bosea sp. 29B]
MSVDILTKIALFVPAFMAVTALCVCLQRRRARRHGEWKYLTPGPYFWLGLFAGVLITAVATLVVAGGRVERTSGLLFTSAFAGITLFLAIQALVEQVRWNSLRIERRTILGRTISLSWFELARIGGEWTGYLWISSFEGPRLRFSTYDNGFDELALTIQRHLPTDLPPASPELAAEPMLAQARLRGRG